MLLLITLSEGLAAIDAVRVDALAPRRSALTALAAIFPLAAFGRAEVSDRVSLKNDAARGAALAFRRASLGRVVEDGSSCHGTLWRFLSLIPEPPALLPVLPGTGSL